jgi:hypothetical protein
LEIERKMLMSKMNRLSVEELEKRGIDPDRLREDADAEKHMMQVHLDGLIKEVERVLKVQLGGVSQVKELITALRHYDIVPERPEPKADTEIKDVPF